MCLIEAQRMRGQMSNKRMQLAGASGLRNVGLCRAKKSPQLMRDPLGGEDNLW